MKKVKKKRVGHKLAVSDKSHSATESNIPVLKATLLFPVLIIMLFSFLVYFNALFGDFVHDDTEQIENNPWIRDIRYIPEIFSKGFWEFGSGSSNFYRPLVHMVYMVNYHIFGLRPWGFHLVNILFHVGNTVLVFFITSRLLHADKLAGWQAGKPGPLLSPPFIAALVFAVHPVHTEAVTWISGSDHTFTFFVLLSFYLYISFRDGVKRGYLLSVLSFSAATLFKEPALTLPIMLIAYDYLFKKSDETIFAGIKRYIPYAVVSGIYLLVRYYVLGRLAPEEFYADLSTYQCIINVFPLFKEYLTSLLWPFNLNLWHTFHPISSLFEAKGMISVVVTVIFCIVAVAAYRKNKVIFFSLLLLVIPLLPVFYIQGIAGTPFAERYLYLPSVGYVLLLAVFFSWVKEKLPLAAKSITIVFIVIVGLYSVGTITRNNVWKDDFTLWSDTVKKSSDSANAHFNLGISHLRKGAVDMAISEYQSALRLKPDFAEAHYNLGNAYASKNQLDMAISEYQAALRLKPDFAAIAYNNLGNVYKLNNQLDMAIAEYQAALRLRPDYAETHYNLGNAYASKNQPDMAIAEYQAALRLRPDYANVHNYIGDAYKSKGQLDMAIAEYQAALRLRPDYANTHNSLGNVYAAKGQWDMAISEYQAALRLRPDYANAHFNLGISHLRKGAVDMARGEFEAVLRISPDNQKARELLNSIISKRH